jgi:uncharacterized OsmC-like protein
VEREQLRAIQKPIKERYREEPGAALITLSASGELDAGEIACSVQTGRALVEAGLHPATGGTGTLACSGDMLLEALVACAGVTLRSVATSMELPVTGSVRAEGDLDFRGTLGVASADEAPVGFRAIRLIFSLDGGGARDEQIAKLLELTERYCVVLQTITGGVPVSVHSTA